MEHQYFSQILLKDQYRSSNIDQFDDEFDLFEGNVKGSDEVLIDAVRGYPHLYDITLKDYKDAKMKENSWSEIAVLMNMSIENYQNRWLRLRERFTKEQRLQQTESRSSSGASRRPVFALYNNMMFLKNHIRHRRSFTNVRNPLKEMNPIKRRTINVSSCASVKQNLTENLSHKSTDGNENSFVPNLSSSNISAHYDSDVSSEEVDITPKTNFSSDSQKIETLETGSTRSVSPLRSESHNSQTCGVFHPSASNIKSISTPTSQIMPKSQRNMGKIKNRSGTYLESSIASLSDTLQHHIANRPLHSTEQTSNCYATPEKSFGMLVGIELEQMPEPEKSIRKQAIAQILWKPYL